MGEDDPSRLWGNNAEEPPQMGHRVSMMSMASEVHHHHFQSDGAVEAAPSHHGHHMWSGFGHHSSADADQQKSLKHAGSMLGRFSFGWRKSSNVPPPPVEHVDSVEIVFIDENKE